jgi:hypothetical protein
MVGIKQGGLFGHRSSPDLAQLQQRNCAKSGDLGKPGSFARFVDT